jgi:hypothetical protein
MCPKQNGVVENSLQCESSSKRGVPKVSTHPRWAKHNSGTPPTPRPLSSTKINKYFIKEFSP